jgi:hypothetical protein
VTKEIPLTKNKVALVDDLDYEELSKYYWHAGPGHRNTFYVRRGVWNAKTKKMETIRLHRQLLGCKSGEIVDHIDGNPLNNQRTNLRIVSNKENSQNLHYETSTNLRGISWYGHRNKWRVYIREGRHQKHLGYYSNLHVAVQTMVVAECVMGCYDDRH